MTHGTRPEDLLSPFGREGDASGESDPADQPQAGASRPAEGGSKGQSGFQAGASGGGPDAPATLGGAQNPRISDASRDLDLGSPRQSDALPTQWGSGADQGLDPGRATGPAAVPDPGLGMGLRRAPGWKAWIKPVIGITLVLAGTIAGLIPFVPGFLLSLIGLPMIATGWPRPAARVKKTAIDWLRATKWGSKMVKTLAARRRTARDKAAAKKQRTGK